MPSFSFAARLVGAPAVAFVAALVLRGAAVLVLGHYRSPTLWENGVIAQYLWQGCGFCMDFSRPGELSSWQAPGYPFLLAIAWRVFGRSASAHLAISLLQAVVLASMVFPVRWLTLRWFGERAATAAMWITCFMPLYVWYATRLHQAGLVMAAHPWLVWSWLRLRTSHARIDAGAAGVLSGVAGLFQPVLLFLAGVIGAGLVMEAWRRSSRQRLIAVAGAGLVAIVVVTPWSVRNYAVHGRVVPIRDSFGKEFWMGNNPHATGTSFAEGGTTEITFAHPPQAFALRGQVSEIELMDAMKAEAMAYIRQDPTAFVVRTAKKIAWFWTTTPASLVRSSLGGEALRFRWLHLGYWLVFLGCALLAVMQMRRLRREYAALLTIYVVTYSILYGLTHVGQARYRGEMEFIVIPLVASGVTVMWAAISARVSSRTPSRRSSFVLTLLVALLAMLPFLPAIGGGFVADDWFMVEGFHRESIAFLEFLWNALTGFGHVPTTFYRPLAFASLVGQFHVTGLDPAPPHVANLLLHGASTAALFVLARRLTGRSGVALVAALAFAWFPRRTEAVAWLSCRPDLLSATFAAVSLVWFERVVDTGRRAWLVASLAAWWLALLSKEAVLVLPLVCVALAWRPARLPTRAQWVWWLGPFIATWPAYLVLRRIAIGAFIGGYGVGAFTPGPATVASGLKYLAYQIVPPLEPLNASLRSTSVVSLVGAVALAVAGLVLWCAWHWRATPAARVGTAWLVAGVAPVVTLPISLSTTFNDRLLYFPAFGVALIAAAGLARIRPRSLAALGVAIGIVVAPWSWMLSQRWAAAGALTRESLTQLARVMKAQPTGRVYLAAVPDSLGGAYMLRSGIPQALNVFDVPDPGRVVPLAWYFISPARPTDTPVRASLSDPATVDLVSVGAQPSLMVGTPEAAGLVDYEADVSNDRFGRRMSARARLREPGPVWLMTPGGLERVNQRATSP